MLTFNLTDIRRLPLLAAVVILGGCGLTQRVVDGSSSALSAIFYPQIGELRLDFVARANLNSEVRDHYPSPQPVMVRVLQLRDRKAFDRSDYHQLAADEATALQGSLLAQRELTLVPGGAQALTLPLEKQSRYVAVIALFQQPDLPGNGWRLVLARSELAADRARVIEFDGQRLRLHEDKT